MSITGVCPVIAVPFSDDGEVDYESFRNLSRWIVGLGTEAVMIFGVASENIKLDDEERYRLLRILCEERRGSDLTIIASVADHSSELAVKRAKRYELMGADYINILPPTFFAPTSLQIHAHLEAILRAVKIPVVIQHLPQAGAAEDVADLVKLANSFENLKIIKCEANPPFSSIEQIKRLSKGKLDVLIGWGGIYWGKGSELGASGVQPGSALTDLYLRAQVALSQGDTPEFNSRLSEFIPYIEKWITNLELLIAVEKRILFKRGIIKSDYCRHPTVAIDEDSERELEELLAKALINL